MSRNRWLTALLVVSVGLNIAAVGFIAGHATGDRFRPPLANPLLGIGGLIRDLPEPRREELSRIMREHGQGMHASIRDMQQAQDALGEALAAPDFDRDAAAAALEAFRENLCRSMAHSNETVLALAAEMTPEERMLLIERMQRRRPGGTPHRPPPPPDGPGGWSDRHPPR